MEKYVLGIDLGGTKISTGIVSSSGRIIESVKVSTKAEEGSDAVIGRIKKSVYDVLEKSGMKMDDISGIGIGSPGPLDSRKGIIDNPSNLPGWNKVPLVKIIEEEFNKHTVLENDANAAALGEYIFGSGRGTDNFFYITVSTGIGGGAVTEGKLYIGANSNAAEIGHTVVDINGPLCNCGKKGCLEAYASGTGLAKAAQREVESGADTLIKEIAAGEKINAEHVFMAAERGDKLAQKLIDTMAYYLGIGIANTMMFYNPEKIAIGGGVSNQWDKLYDKMMASAREWSLKPLYDACTVVRAELGGNVGLVGAAALAL